MIRKKWYFQPAEYPINEYEENNYLFIIYGNELSDEDLKEKKFQNYPIIPLSELKDFLIKHPNWRLYKDFVNDVMKEDIVLLEGIKLYTPSF